MIGFTALSRARRLACATTAILGLAGAAGLASISAPAVAAVAAVKPAGPSVRIDNFAFGPAVLTVSVGSQVTWTNNDDAPHTVVAVSGAFRSAALDTGDHFTFTFAKPGEYAYFCSLHPHMTGKVVVTPR